jgi:hypothetical protein
LPSLTEPVTTLHVRSSWVDMEANDPPAWECSIQTARHTAHDLAKFAGPAGGACVWHDRTVGHPAVLALAGPRQRGAARWVLKLPGTLPAKNSPEAAQRLSARWRTWIVGMQRLAYIAQIRAARLTLSRDRYFWRVCKLVWIAFSGTWHIGRRSGVTLIRTRGGLALAAPRLAS